MLIVSPELKVELKSVLNNLIAERVVDHIEDASPRNGRFNQKVDPKQLELFKILAREINCGLYVKENDAFTWFGRFATFKKGSMTNKEFILGIESLEATLFFEKPETVIQAYHDSLIQRQNNTLGYNEALLLID